MIIKKAHCFFEQSGTFKNEFIKLGITAEDYLKNNFIKEPTIVDLDRTRRGDYFVKPTGYWFFNFTNTFGRSFQKPKERKKIKNISGGKGGLCNTERSMISPDYARNFICDFIIGKSQVFTQTSLFD